MKPLLILDAIPDGWMQVWSCAPRLALLCCLPGLDFIWSGMEYNDPCCLHFAPDPNMFFVDPGIECPIFGLRCILWPFFSELGIEWPVWSALRAWPCCALHQTWNICLFLARAFCFDLTQLVKNRDGILPLSVLQCIPHFAHYIIIMNPITKSCKVIKYTATKIGGREWFMREPRFGLVWNGAVARLFLFYYTKIKSIVLLPACWVQLI